MPLGSNPKKEGKRAKANAVRQSDGTFVFLCVLGLAAALIGLTAAAATAEIIMVALLLFVIAVAVAVSGPEEYNGGVKKTARYITHGDSGEKVEHRSNFDGERYASLSQREDIQLAIVPSNRYGRLVEHERSNAAGVRIDADLRITSIALTHYSRTTSRTTAVTILAAMVKISSRA